MTGFLLCVESQISELTEKLIILESRLNQNLVVAASNLLTDFLLKTQSQKLPQKEWQKTWEIKKVTQNYS